MNWFDEFQAEHRELTRRYFVKAGLAGAALAAGMMSPAPRRALAAGAHAPDDAEKAARFESYLTPDERFSDVSRGEPVPHGLPDEKKSAVGLTRESWRLEIISDPEHPVRMRKPLTKADNTAIDFPTLMSLAEKHAVRFPKIMTCLNLGCPLGMGLWEGVPLRELIALAQPRDGVRRVFYYGYHNDDPKQMFRSSLPLGRVLEDYYDLPPITACYKLNGQWLSNERGGPVRIVVPEGYGFKSVKWLSHVVLTNLFHANDTYAEQGNDVDSPMKTFATFLSAPREAKAGMPIPLSGFAQVGISGLSKVQAWIAPEDHERPEDDPYFDRAPWIDMKVLAAPTTWGGGLPDDVIPPGTHGFDAQTGRPKSWPLRLCAAHWAGVYPSLEPGKYLLRCRSLDENGVGQPLPRPSIKSGRAGIEQVRLVVT